MNTVSRRKFLKTTLQAIAVLPVASMVESVSIPEKGAILTVDKDGNATLNGLTVAVDKKNNATVRKE